MNTTLDQLIRRDGVAAALWLIIWAVCTGLSLAFFAAPSTTPVEEDEVYWIGSSYYYTLAFQQWAWRHEDWKLLPARENPPIAKYVIGLGLHATGQPVTNLNLLGSFYALFETVPGAWGTGDDFAKRTRVVARMQPGVHEAVRREHTVSLARAALITARRTMIVCAILASLCICLLGTQLGRWPTGLLASQLLLAHPVVRGAYNHALADAVVLFLSVAAAGAGFAYLRHLSIGSPHRRCVRLGLPGLAGLMLGLACAAKMNALVVVFLLVAGIGCVAVRAAWVHDGRQLRASIIGGAVMLVSALAVFVVINPAIVQAPLSGLVATVREHQLTEKIQTAFLSGRLETLPARLTAVAQISCFHFVAFAAVSAVAAGCAFRAHRASGQRLLGWWWFVACISVVAWIPFSRERYVMPLLPPQVLLTATAAAHGLRWIYGVAKPKKKQTDLKS